MKTIKITKEELQHRWVTARKEAARFSYRVAKRRWFLSFKNKFSIQCRSYHPDGLRHSKSSGASVVTHLWDGQNIVAEIGTTGNVTARYPRGINLIVWEKVDANSDTYYYLFNAHGDVIQHINLSGEIKSYKYDTFGNEQSPEKLDYNPFRYCGEYFDRETGEIYLRARYYNPAIGRFGAEDAARSRLNWSLTVEITQ